MSDVINIGLSQSAVDDLMQSGLDPSDMGVRKATSTEYASTGYTGGRTPDGYVIPYYDLEGERLPYYRIKLLEPTAGPKYRAMRDRPNHIYFPKGLRPLMRMRRHDYMIITEGEKKAACAVRNGFPCVALSGVDNWRNRQIVFPDTTKLTADKVRGVIKAKIPSGDSNSLVLQESGVVAEGFNDLVDFLVRMEMGVIIVFDTDAAGVKTPVQRSAAQLGYELRYRGLPIARIRQLVLPPSTTGQKVGLDDYLTIKGAKDFGSLVRVCKQRRIAFPRHPNPKVFVAGRLQKGRMSRKETQDVALSVLMELETRGRRLRNTSSHQMYFFDTTTHTLLDVHLGSNKVMLHDTAFGSYLYREFNLSAVDSRVIGWLATQYHGEPGIDDAVTHRTIARPPKIKDAIAYQLSDSHFIIITGDPDKPYLVCQNGEHGVMFQQGQVEPLSHRDIETEIEHYLESDEVLWRDVLSGFNLNPSLPQMDAHDDPDAPSVQQLLQEGRDLATLLFYMSPWLLRWRGMQLPVEMTIGEPGSGKSSLYELRQMIISGAPRLSNMTLDIKDWYSGITSQGGLHVLDNVHFTTASKDYRQRLSDELCRLVTEPSPHVEMRKLYTNADVLSLPVSCTFALTSIEQPFFTTDLIQRAAVFELQSITTGHDANWVRTQLNRGHGRMGWVAHQLAIIHKFLRYTVHEHGWTPDYRAGHRLAHYEQGLCAMAHVLGFQSDWIPPALKRLTTTKMTEADWTLAGIGDFMNEVKRKYGDKYTEQRFGTKEIVAWAEQHDTHSKNRQLSNSWSLGRYFRSHKGLLMKTHGIHEDGTEANRQMYSIK